MKLGTYLERDFTHRKRETLLCFFTILFNQAIFTIVLFFWENFNGIFNPNSWIFSFFGIFFLLSLIIAGSIGIFLFYITFNMFMLRKQKDIGVFSALGGMPKILSWILLSELFVITISASFLGVFSGNLIYLVFYLLGLTFQFQVSIRIPWLALFLCVIINLILTWIFGGYELGSYLKQPAIKLLEGKARKHIEEIPKQKKKKRPKLSRIFSQRSLIRLKKMVNRTYIVLIIGSFLFSFFLAGSLIAQQTTYNYLEHAIGHNTYVVGHRDIVQEYQRMLTLDLNQVHTNFDFTNADYFINTTIISQLKTITNDSLDLRLLVCLTAHEFPYYHEYYTFGGNRIVNTLVVGIQPDSFLPNLLLTKGKKIENILRELDNLHIIYGDWLEQHIISFEEEHIELYNGSTKISTLLMGAGTCHDPLNNGNLLYMNKTLLESLLILPNSTNLCVIRPDTNQQIESIRTLIESDGNLTMLDLEPLLFRNGMYVLISFLPMFLFSGFYGTIMYLGLITFQFISISDRASDFGILRALGVKNKTIRKIVFNESLNNIFPATIVGYLITIVLSLFLFETIGITIMTILGILGCILILSFGMLLLLTYTGTKLTKRTKLYNPYHF